MRNSKGEPCARQTMFSVGGGFVRAGGRSQAEWLRRRSILCKTRRIGSLVAVSLGVAILLGGRVEGNILSPIGASAQNATPTAGMSACTVKPRAFQDLAELSDEPPGTLLMWRLGTPVPAPDLPIGGHAADQEVASAITGVVHEQIACTNAGDLLRLTSLMTDEYLVRRLGGIPEEAFTELAVPRELPKEDQARLLSVDDVRVFPDGRVSAIVRTDKSTTEFVFIMANDRYLITDEYELNLEGTPVP